MNDKHDWLAFQREERDRPPMLGVALLLSMLLVAMAIAVTWAATTPIVIPA